MLRHYYAITPCYAIIADAARGFRVTSLCAALLFFKDAMPMMLRCHADADMPIIDALQRCLRH